MPSPLVSSGAKAAPSTKAPMMSKPAMAIGLALKTSQFKYMR